MVMPSPYPMFMQILWRNFVRQKSVFPLVFWGMVVNSPSMGVGVILMAILPFFAVVIALEYSMRQWRPNNLWGPSGLKLLSLLHCYG